jgi:hypothetical protein
MEIHIGNQIKTRLLETGMSKSEFARRINKTSQNVYDIFERKTIDTGLLTVISKTLEFNFFLCYAQEMKKEGITAPRQLEQDLTSVPIGDMISSLLQMEQKISDQINEILTLKKEISYLMEINGLLSGRNKIK